MMVRRLVAIIAIASLFPLSVPVAVFAQSAEELQQQIDEQNAQITADLEWRMK
jgi:predicted ATP-grasp superfamily ATP-dependent carboligase